MTLHVYKAIAAVAAELAHDGVAKTKSNQQQGYKFRGIDDVYNALAPCLAKHGLVILPRCVERVVTERETKSGGSLFGVTVRCEFDFVAAEDGSKHTVATYGEAMDSADKATNKAMSAAYKYAAFQTFCIPTEGDNDADATTHDVRGRGQPQPAPPARMSPEKMATLKSAYDRAKAACPPDKPGAAFARLVTIVGRQVRDLNEVPADKADECISAMDKMAGVAA